MRYPIVPITLLLALAPAGSGEAAVTEIGIDSFEDVTSLGFEELSPPTSVTTQYQDLELTFEALAGAVCRSEAYASYSAELAAFASGLGLGERGLTIGGEAVEITFATPVQRVGFTVGSNAPVQVPVLVDGEGDPAAFTLSVAQNQIAFFGFEDPVGISSLRLGKEQTEEFLSMLDGLRFEREPTGSVERIAQDDFPPTPAPLDFEEFEEEEQVAGQFAADGVTFSSRLGSWAAARYDGYGDELVAVALATGAGAVGLLHVNDGETISFDPPATKVGFHFGSNVPVRVPITFRRGGADSGAFTIVVPETQLGFFGFTDQQGIEEVRFGEELVESYSSNLDLLRFVPEPADGAAAALAALALLASGRRRERR